MQRRWDISKLFSKLKVAGSDKQKHNCDDTLHKVMLALDGEMNDEDAKTFLNELNQCGHCLDKYNIEKSFKSFLQEKIVRHTASSKCVQSIREKIASADKQE